jgi:hypothetical protein
MVSTLCNWLLLIILLVCSNVTHAQQAETFGPYELHYSVVNTTFLEPKTAATYGITRGDKRAILNLAVRENTANGSRGRTMQLQGTTWDLIHRKPLEFKEIREGDAIYYIAEFTFINEEWLFFELDFQPEGSDQAYSFKFKQQLYVD